jgi:putative nucleotidyltransferase with HDIG domain
MLFSNLKDQIEKRGTIVLRFVEDQVVLGQTPIYELSEAPPGFVQSCLNRQVQGVIFSKGLEAGELTSFMEAMTLPLEELESKGGIQREVLSRGIKHISLEELAQPKETEETDDDTEWELGKKIYGKAVSELKKTMEHVQSSKSIRNADSINGVVNEIIDSLSRKSSVLLGLTSIKNYDEYTFYHSVNVGILAVSLGARLSLQREQLAGLGVSAILHDIGKVLVPENVLNKPRELSNDEWLLMQRHPVDGARILRKSPELPKWASVVAFEHHIKHDLSGYPNLVRLRKLSLYSLIASIADCYDAMTTLRPYRKPSTPGDTLREMSELSGRDFEPALLEMFADMIGKYPVGSLVRLDTNEFAVVYDINLDDGERPIVKLIIDDKGQGLEPGIVADLRERNLETGRYQRSIIQALDPISKEINVAKFL